MPHKVTVASPLPTGVEGLTFPAPDGGPGQPVVAGQIVYVSDEAFGLIPNWWFTTSNSFGSALLTDGGEIAATGTVTNLAVPTVTLAGTTAGTVTYGLVSNGNYKQLFVSLEGYQNTTSTAQTITSTNTNFGGGAVSFSATSGANGITRSTFAIASSSGTTVASGSGGADANFVWAPSTSTLTLPYGSGGAAINGIVVVEGL